MTMLAWHDRGAVRPDMRPENPIEWLALRFNLAPKPVGEAMFGMPMARSIMAGVRLGVFERLAKGPPARRSSRASWS